MKKRYKLTKEQLERIVENVVQESKPQKEKNTKKN
jgi:hypothetical protein